MGSISCHITPLVVDSLGCAHTHIHMSTYICPHRNNLKKPGMHRLQASTCTQFNDWQTTVINQVHFGNFHNFHSNNYIVLQLPVAHQQQEDFLTCCQLSTSRFMYVQFLISFCLLQKFSYSNTVSARHHSFLKVKNLKFDLNSCH